MAEKEMMRPKSDSVALQIMCVNVNIFQDNIENNFNFIPLIDLCMIFNPYIKLRKVQWRCRWVGVTWKILQFREDEIYHTLEDDNKDHFTHNSGLSLSISCSESNSNLITLVGLIHMCEVTLIINNPNNMMFFEWEKREVISLNCTLLL